MNDQASTLRELMEQRRQSHAPARSAQQFAYAQSLAFLSGKGGVGKTNIALNSAIALQKMGRRVCLWDLSGLANLDLLCGLSGYWDFSHVLSGARRLDEVLIAGPEGVRILSGLNRLSDMSMLPGETRKTIVDDIEALEREFDDVVLDLPTGFSPLTSRAAIHASRAILVTTPEPTSIADSYATVKSMLRRGTPTLSLLVNQIQSAEQAFDIIDRIQQTSRMFLQYEIGVAGYVPADPGLARAVLRRRPVVIDSPHSPASEAIIGLARRLPTGESPTASLIRRLVAPSNGGECP